MLYFPFILTTGNRDRTDSHIYCEGESVSMNECNVYMSVYYVLYDIYNIIILTMFIYYFICNSIHVL